MSFLALFLAAYLLGSFPTGPLLARLKGVDLRSVGSGNIGATNVTRALGKGFGALTLLGDALKGWIAVELGIRASLPPEALLLVAGGAFFGHLYPIFLRFQGGKGVATAFGVLLALEPRLAGGVLLVWVAAFALTRTSALGALSAALALPLLGLAFRLPAVTIRFFAALSLALFLTHHENIERILKGKEGHWAPKGKPDPGLPA